MAKVRSPNFPVVDLQDAIDAVGKIYTKEKRGKFPKESAARHLGYTSLNGRSLGMIAALRAYGLLEGRADDLVVTPDAIALLEAPADSTDRLNALQSAISAPPMFVRIAEQYPDAPSPQTLKWWLIQQGFASDGADKATSIYLSSLQLVSQNQGVYDLRTDVERDAELAEAMQDDPQMKAVFHAATTRRDAPAPTRRVEANESLAMSIHERVLTSGLLSKQATFRVIVSGPVGEAEIDRLLKKLEMDKEILADVDPVPPMPDTSHEPDYQREWEESSNA
jgi:hypothetical protein